MSQRECSSCANRLLVAGISAANPAPIAAGGPIADWRATAGARRQNGGSGRDRPRDGKIKGAGPGADAGG